MKQLSIIILLSLLTLSGCAYEQTVFGVRESVWNRLTPAQQDAVMLNYQRQQEIQQQQDTVRTLIDSAKELLEREQDLRTPSSTYRNTKPSAFKIQGAQPLSKTIPLLKKNHSSFSQSSQSYCQRGPNSIAQGYTSSSSSHSSTKSNSMSVGVNPAGALDSLLDMIN